MDERISFGYWVRRRRKALDLTSEELAQQVGCAGVTIRKIEADGRRLSRQIAERQAESVHQTNTLPGKPGKWNTSHQVHTAPRQNVLAGRSDVPNTHREPFFLVGVGIRR